VHKHGHAFAESVAEMFRKNRYEARTKIKMPQLGAPKNPDLGDIDVLAWRSDSKIVFLVEAKRLTPALTVREVIQRLEEFRGDEKRNDSLGKHVRRVKWLENNLVGIEKLTRIPATEVQVRSLLVTSESVPMQFFSEMNFPTDHVVPVDELTSALSCFEA
jgi:hypothetical protein